MDTIPEDPETEVVSDSQADSDEELSLPQFCGNSDANDPQYEDTFAETYVGPESYENGAMGDNEDSGCDSDSHGTDSDWSQSSSKAQQLETGADRLPFYFRATRQQVSTVCLGRGIPKVVSLFENVRTIIEQSDYHWMRLRNMEGADEMLEDCTAEEKEAIIAE